MVHNQLVNRSSQRVHSFGLDQLSPLFVASELSIVGPGVNLTIAVVEHSIPVLVLIQLVEGQVTLGLCNLEVVDLRDVVATEDHFVLFWVGKDIFVELLKFAFVKSEHCKLVTLFRLSYVCFC